MRKIVLATTVALLTLLGLTGAAFAADLPSHRSPGGSPPGNDARAAAMKLPAHFLPLGVKLAGTAVVNGHTYDYYGSPVSGVYVYWDAPFGETWEWGETHTDYTGAYSFTGLPAASGTGYVQTSYPTDPWYAMWRKFASWSDPGTTTFDFRPGAVPTSITRGGGVWEGWDLTTTYLYGSDALSYVAGATDIAGSGTVVTGNAYVGEGTYTAGATYFWIDQGVEFPLSAAVTAGAVSGQSVSVTQAGAQRISVTTPYWGSGKPGTAVKVRNWNFPAGWTLDYYGYADSPSQRPYKEYTDLTTTGADPFTKSVTIPKTAPAGYWYLVGADHSDGFLDLETPFQVCTLKPTKSSVRKGSTIRLTGVVPTEGHWGSQAGKSKYVWIFKRTRSVSAPPKGDPTKAGWTFVKRVRASGLGKYATGNLTVKRTTWYVAFYEGDDWYWPAFTSVAKVRAY